MEACFSLFWGLSFLGGIIEFLRLYSHSESMVLKVKIGIAL